MHKNKLFNYLKKGSLGALIISLIFFAFVALPEGVLINNKVVISADTWHSDLVELGKNDTTYSNYVDISDLVTVDASTNLVTQVKDPNSQISDTVTTLIKDSVIRISSGLEMYYFSEICNPKLSNGTVNSYYTTYLTLSYTLGADINYEEASSKYRFFRPIGWEAAHPFSGIFDGDACTISNLFYKPIKDSDEYASEYNSAMIYYALFSINAGLIKNVGIIQANNIQYDIYDPLKFASPFVGLNSGTIENSFVQDLRGNNAGLSCEGGYVLSQFVNVNNDQGKIINSYAAVSRISSSSIVFSEASGRHPFINGNTGTITNCYYDDQILTGLNTYEQKTDVDYGELKALQTADFNDLTKFKDINNIWNSNATYDKQYAAYLKLTYPVLKGFKTYTDKDNNTYFVIENAIDLIYFSELISKYDPFRKANYILTADIDMNSVKPGSFVLSQSVFTGVFKGAVKKNTQGEKPIYLANGELSKKYSILNFNINQGVSYLGYHAYGIFGVLGGTVDNINIVNATINQNDLTTTNFNEKNVIGAVSGLLLGSGKILNVDVYADINLQCKDKNNPNKYLGAEYAGGAVGYVENGTLQNVTTNGTITAGNVNLSSASSIASEVANITYDASIGGVIGKIGSSQSITNLTNSMDIESFRYDIDPQIELNQYIGGVIGSGNVNNTKELQNNGNIFVGSPIGKGHIANKYYSDVYLAGVIGLVNEAEGINGSYLNNGLLKYFVDDNNIKAYLSGVLNVISTSSMLLDKSSLPGGLPAGTLNRLKDQEAFVFHSLTSARSLKLVNKLSASRASSKLEHVDSIVNGMDLRVAGVVYSYLTNLKLKGVYNVNKYYKKTFTNKVRDKGTDLVETIDISMIDEFAPLVNSDNEVAFKGNKLYVDTNFLPASSTTLQLDSYTKLQTTINIEQAYNYKNVNYITTHDVKFFMLQCSGALNGRNFNIANLRNDGNIKVYFTNTSKPDVNYSMNKENPYKFYGDYKKLKVYGCMEEVSLGHNARDIYNGGKIIISSNNNATNPTNDYVNYNLYVAGICYKNIGENITKSSNKNVMIDSGFIGSLNNVVNNGEIRITNGDIIANDNITESGYFYGVSRIGGITCFNASTLSNAFNLGNIYNINSIRQNGGEYAGGAAFEVETGGICFITQNQILYKAPNNDYANYKYTRSNIIDSANNGCIVSMNTNPNAGAAAWTNASGFVVRNERSEEGYKSNDGNSTAIYQHRQKIQFCINYGDIIAYNADGSDDAGSEHEPRSKAAGFVCLGMESIVDVVNYGNIYGTKVSGGMYGYIFLSDFIESVYPTASESDPVYVANALNYGQIKYLVLSNENIAKIKTITSSNTKSLKCNVDNYNNGYPLGALIGMIRGNGSGYNLSIMNIKNLVNLFDDVNIVGRSFRLGFEDRNTKVETTKYMATTKPNDTSPAPFEKGGSGANKSGVKSYFKTDQVPTNSGNFYSREHNGGIFNKSYILRTAPALRDANGNIVNDISQADPNNTDNFIADYLQFIPYSKVNEYLINKLGLKDVVYQNAMNNAINSITVIHSLLNLKQGSLSSSKTVFEAIYNSNKTKLEDNKAELLVELSKLLNNGNYTQEQIKNIFDALASDANLNTIINEQDVVNLIKNYINGLNDNEARSLVNSLLLDSSYLQTLINNNLTLISTILNTYANDPNITPEAQTLVTNIYKLLKNDNNSLADYLSSLTVDEKNDLANKLYPLCKNNDEVIKTIATNFYDEVIANLSTTGDLNKLNDYIINGNNNLVDNDYINIYKDFIRIQYSDVINVLSQQDFIELLKKINSQLDTNTALFNFLNDGRLNTPDLYLEVSKSLHIAIINSKNFNYIGNGNNLGTNEVFSGDTLDINGTKPTNKVEMHIVPGHYSQSILWWTDYYSWSLSGNSFTFNTSREAPKGEFKIAWRPNQGYNHILAWPSNITGTGVYGDRVASSSSNEDFNFNNVQIAKFINYGTGTSGNEKQLTKEVFRQLEELASTNYQKAKDYFINIYNNSTLDNSSIIALLDPSFTPSSNVAEMKAYINSKVQANNTNGNPDYNKYTKLYIDAITSNITNQLDKGRIVQLFKVNGSDYVSILNTLMKYGNLPYNEIKLIVADFLLNGYNRLGDKATMNNYLKQVLKSDVVTLEQLKALLNSSINDNKLALFKKAMEKGFTKDEYLNLINLLLSKNIQLVANIIRMNPTIVDYNLINLVNSYLIKGNQNLFTQYTGISDLDTLIDTMEKAGLDWSDVTDYTGIYALASSYGIENGLFIPDNIKLSGLDPVSGPDNNLSYDTSWRGGTPDNPDAYMDDQGHLLDPNSVNTKVYYEMKQLKKSISTVIFRMELLGNVDGVNHTVKNEIIPENYDLKNHAIHFYIPANFDILKSNELVINPIISSYELAYKASFDEATDKLTINIPATATQGNVYSDTFTVQAEDTRVKTTYTCYVHITEPSYLDPVTGVKVNVKGQDNKNASYQTQKLTGSKNEKITNILVNTLVRGYDGKIHLTYTTVNITNDFSFIDITNIYRVGSLASIPSSINGINFSSYVNMADTIKLESNITNKDKYDYSYDLQTLNNGYAKVRNGQTTGTIDLCFNLSNDLSKGVYLIEIKVSSSCTYYVMFEKEASDQNRILSIKYNNQAFNPKDTETSNINAKHTHRYGTKLTKAFIRERLPREGYRYTVPEYLDELLISPLATYEIDEAGITLTEVQGKKVYKIPYIITAEDGTTSRFDHYITEVDVSTAISNIFYNGALVVKGPIEKDTAKPYIYESQFEKEETPAYTFEYSLDAFYSEFGSTNYFHILMTDATGTKLPDATVEELSKYVDISINEGMNFSVSFSIDAPSIDYYFKPVYETSFLFDEASSTPTSWHYEFDIIHITKIKNRNSYLNNITFISESVISSIRTMVTTSDISLQQYKEMLDSPERQIVCLPDKIYYNTFDITYTTNNDGTISINKPVSNFFVIGLVSRTSLDNYSPNFNLPNGGKVYRVKEIGGVIYKYRPYEVTTTANGVSKKEIVILLQSEDGSRTLLPDEQTEVTDMSKYTLSVFDGVPEATVDGKVLPNPSLVDNFNEHGSFKEDPNYPGDESKGHFEYIKYRVYSEYYQDAKPNEKELYYTDYSVACQDITNNIRFTLTVKYDNTDPACSNIKNELYNVYLQFSCYQRIGSSTSFEATPSNKVGIFAFFNQEKPKSNILTHESVQSNSSGMYDLYMYLPNGYSYKVKVTDRKIPTEYQAGEKFEITSSITAREIQIEVTIIKANIIKPWGNEETNSSQSIK